MSGISTVHTGWLAGVKILENCQQEHYKVLRQPTPKTSPDNFWAQMSKTKYPFWPSKLLSPHETSPETQPVRRHGLKFSSILLVKIEKVKKFQGF